MRDWRFWFAEQSGTLMAIAIFIVMFFIYSANHPAGFSANVVRILSACGVDQPFTVNVLEEPEIRQGIKGYANWPTIPQLYVNGEFVGGSDILTEMFESGELKTLLSTVKA